MPTVPKQQDKEVIHQNFWVRVFLSSPSASLVILRLSLLHIPNREDFVAPLHNLNLARRQCLSYTCCFRQERSISLII